MWRLKKVNADRKLVVGFPSRKGLTAVRKCVNSIVATANMPTQIVIAFDDDDMSYRSCPNWPFVDTYLLRPRHYYCRAVNALFAHIEQAAEGTTDYFMLTHDDVEFMVPDWGNLALETYNSVFPDGAGILELFSPGLCSHYVSRVSFIRDKFNGRLADPVYTNYFSDSHMLNQCAEEGWYGALLLEEGLNIINHDLYSTRDAASLEVQEAWFHRDKELYRERWPQAVEEGLRANWKLLKGERK
jgi:hypothetical protein